MSSGYLSQSIGQAKTDWTTTHTGYGTNPVGNFTYTPHGDYVHVEWQATSNGISNAATLTMTMPYSAHSSCANLAIPVMTLDNTTNAIGRMVFRGNSNVVDFYPTATSNNWTGTAVAKGVRFSVWYRIA